MTISLFDRMHYKLKLLNCILCGISPDVEAFAKAMETESKSTEDGDAKDKKDDDEDMSLD